MDNKSSSFRIVEIRISVEMDLNHIQRREFRIRQDYQHVDGGQPDVLDRARAKPALSAGPEERIKRGVVKKVPSQQRRTVVGLRGRLGGRRTGVDVTALG